MEDAKLLTTPTVSPTSSSPTSTISSGAMSCSPSVDDIFNQQLCDVPFCDLQCCGEELHHKNECVSCGAYGIMHVRGCHVWAMEYGDTTDIFPAFSCRLFISKQPCSGCDVYAIRYKHFYSSCST